MTDCSKTDGFIKVQIRFFAICREKVGKGSIFLNLEPGSSVQDLTKIIVEQFPELKDILSRSKVSVNLKFVQTSHILRDGDEVALIPPVSGG